MPTIRTLPLLTVLVVTFAAAACAGGATGQASPSAAPEPPQRPLAPLAAQRIVVAPVHRVVEGDALGWAARIPRQQAWLRGLDTAITAELGERGLATAWVYPDVLIRAYRRNPSLSPDPYRLAAAPLTGLTKIDNDRRLPDPLASQIRTLVAVHDGRFVLIPVQVAFEPAGEGRGRAVMRLALLDARASEVSWLGDVRSDVFSTLTPGVTASLAAGLADLIAAP